MRVRTIDFNRPYDDLLRVVSEYRENGTLWGRKQDAKCFETHKRRARKARRCDRMSTTQWRKTLAYFGGRCGYCGAPDTALVAEHMTPLSRGGDHVAENVVPACRDCNHRKHDRTLIEFLISEMPDA